MVKIYRAVHEEKKAFDLSIHAIADDVYPVDHIEYTIDDYTRHVLSVVRPSGLVSGGVTAWHGEGYIFNVGAAAYYILSAFYTSDYTQVTLDPADGEHPRIDVIAVNIDGGVEVITGEPSPDPVRPQVDPSTQLMLTFITVGADTTEPDIEEELIYDENTEPWTGFFHAINEVNLEHTAISVKGERSLRLTGLNRRCNMFWTRETPLNISDFTTLSFFIKTHSEYIAGNAFNIMFVSDTGHVVGRPVRVAFVSNGEGWEFVSLDLAMFGITGLVHRIVFQWGVWNQVAGNTFPQLTFDYIKLDTTNFPWVTKIHTDMSVTGLGTKEYPVHLVGDELNPSPNYYYGTDPDGFKGYHPIPILKVTENNWVLSTEDSNGESTQVVDLNALPRVVGASVDLSGFVVTLTDEEEVDTVIDLNALPRLTDVQVDDDGFIFGTETVDIEIPFSVIDHNKLKNWEAARHRRQNYEEALKAYKIED